jgi:hypothetical protein
MRTVLGDAEHLFRIAGLFVVGLVLFLTVRTVLVPADFGKNGHYRAGAIDDNAARPVVYGGRAVCADCHGAVVTARAGGEHERIGCETCHGPAAAHAEDPTSGSPELPDPRVLCAGCHAVRAGRPAEFPQVDVAEHAGDASCKDCHDPHHPDFD